ncbi:MAG: sensor histidine kinase [Anaerolineaceae bacterium]|nr:sensor histidine kinase [Anaerolineaceae bacterium]
MIRKIKGFLSLKRTIQVDLMLALILIAILPVSLVNQFYYNNTRSFIEEKVKNYNNEIVKQTGKQLETLVTQIGIVEEQLTSYFISAESNRYYGDVSVADKIFMQNKTENQLKTVRRSYMPIKDIYILFDDGSFYSTNTLVNRKLLLGIDWIKGMFLSTIRETIIPTHAANYSNLNNSNQSPEVVSFLKKIVVGNRTRFTVVILIDVDHAKLKNILEGVDLDKNTLLYLEDGQGNLIYSGGGNPIELASQKTTDPNNRIGYYSIEYPIEPVGWKLTALIPEAPIYSQLTSASRNSIGIMVIAIIFSFAVSYVLSKRITSPIQNLVNNMKKAGEGDFTVVSIESKNYEILTLYKSFNRMVTRIDNLMTKIVEKETEKTTAQFKALEAQINPHFLYNTLETIRSIAIQSQVQNIADMCKSLADMLRYSISRNTEFVTLEDEIRHIKNYMNIQMTRFGEKINVEYLIDAELFEFKIIKLILQPLVENAIFHGLELKRGKGRIILSAYRDEDNLYINIVDDGLGIEPEKVEWLNAVFQGLVEFDRSDAGINAGIGMINVNSRVKLYYGNQYGLCISSVQGKETLIQVHLPLVQ